LRGERERRRRRRLAWFLERRKGWFVSTSSRPFS
jgi:hypothetical protein